MCAARHKNLSTHSIYQRTSTKSRDCRYKVFGAGTEEKKVYVENAKNEESEVKKEVQPVLPVVSSIKPTHHPENTRLSNPVAQPSPFVNFPTPYNFPTPSPYGVVSPFFSPSYPPSYHSHYHPTMPSLPYYLHPGCTSSGPHVTFPGMTVTAQEELSSRKLDEMSKLVQELNEKFESAVGKK